MAEKTAIAWCHDTWSPWIGCQKAGPGCDHCYAEAWAKRTGRNFAKRTRTAAAYWRKPLKWDREATGSRRVFPSVCDPFDNQVPEEWREEFYRLIWNTPHLTWLLLTKRIGNAAKMLPGCPPRNMWIGATVCNQEEAARDLDKLRRLPVAIRFLSLEPLLGPIHFEHLRGIDWVIVGAESGGKRRTFRHSWLRQIADKCRDERVPLFVKQDSALYPGERGTIPDKLWIREFPA